MQAKLLALALLAGLAQAAVPAHAEAAKISHFSGKPVPRFEALRYSAVNGRAGPSRDHPILWRYEREGLPMLIIKESRDWRRVRDPGGDEVWVHARMLAPSQSAMVRGEVELRVRPEPGARAIARLQDDLLVALGACDEGWCRVQAAGREGWVPSARLWGAGAPDTPL